MATAIFRPASFLADSRVGLFRRLIRAAAVACLSLIPVGVVAERLQLELGRLDHPALALVGVRAELGAEGAPASISVERLVVGAREWHNVRVRCGRLLLSDNRVRCQAGSLRLPGWFDDARLDFDFDPGQRAGTVTIGIDRGASFEIVLSPTGDLDVSFATLPVAWLRERLEPLPSWEAWHSHGQLDGRARYRAGSREWSMSGRLTEGAFASPDGMHAGEALELAMRVTIRPDGRDQSWSGELSWDQGEAYLHPVYLTAGARLSATGRLRADRLDIARATLEIEGVRVIEGSAEIDLDPVRIERAALAVADADLSVIGPRFIAPLVAPARTGTLRFEGAVSAGMQVAHGELVHIDLALAEVGFALDDGGLGFGPLNGAVPWSRDRKTAAWLSVGGGHWEKLHFGVFELEARLTGSGVEVDRVAIPVLDGRLVLDALALERKQEGWAGRGAAVIEPISMNLLSAAVGLPPMSGVLSASMPGLHVLPGEISLEGALVVSVFDGYLQATNLHAIDPLGVASRISVDVEARNLDLAQLTEAFSFGSVSGFLDADVLGLELVRWRPVRFSASVRSSPGSYPRRISQRAVQNIGALGGGGAAAAIQRGFLGFFDSFGYRRIGLSCVLSGGVCRMDGIEPGPGDGFVIVRGGGVPALNVIGYNRRVDWNELLDRLQRVIESNTGPVIE